MVCCDEMSAESDGSLLSRLDWGEMQFVNDDCGVCACEVDGRSRSWSNADCPGVEGDILEFDRGTYLHYAVKVDKENVVHITGDGPVKWKDIASCSSKNAIVKKESFTKVACGSVHVQIWNKYDRKYKPYTADEIVRRALSKIDRRGYHLLFKNCEHFSNWCRYGISMSHQAEVLGATLAAALGGASLGLVTGPLGALLGAAGGVAVIAGTALARHEREHQRAQERKRSVSAGSTPPVLLRFHSIQNNENGDLPVQSEPIAVNGVHGH